MAEAYWTPKEKEDLSSRYSTSLIKENCNSEELKDRSLPSDAYIVTYKVDDAVRNDLVDVMLRSIFLTCTTINLERGVS